MSPATPVASASPSSSADAAPSTRSRVCPRAASCAPRPGTFDVVPVGITPEGAWVLTDARPDDAGDHRRPAAGGERHRAPARLAGRPASLWSALSLGARRGGAPDRGRRRVPGAARPVRRGRHDPGPARDGRRALRRRRACCQRGRHGQGVHQEARSPPTACRSATTSCCAPGDATLDRRASATGSDCRCSSSRPGPVRRSASPRCTDVGRARRRHRGGPRARPQGARRGGRSRPRDRVRRARGPDGDAEAQRAGGDPGGAAEARVLRLRGQVPRRRLPSSTCPANLDDDVADAGAASWRCAAFEALDCEGLARVDFFVEPGRRPRRQRDQHDARVHRRSRCSRGCGPRPASTTRRCWPRWSRPPWPAAPACVDVPAPACVCAEREPAARFRALFRSGRRSAREVSWA